MLPIDVRTFALREPANALHCPNIKAIPNPWLTTWIQSNFCCARHDITQPQHHCLTISHSRLLASIPLSRGYQLAKCRTSKPAPGETSSSLQNLRLGPANLDCRCLRNALELQPGQSSLVLQRKVKMRHSTWSCFEVLFCPTLSAKSSGPSQIDLNGFALHFWGQSVFTQFSQSQEDWVNFSQFWSVPVTSRQNARTSWQQKGVAKRNAAAFFGGVGG